MSTNAQSGDSGSERRTEGPTATRGKKRPQGIWGAVWHRYRRSRSGLIGLGLTVMLIGLGFLAPLLANRSPLMCKYDGAVYMPAVVEFGQSLPGVGVLFEQSWPFDQVSFNFKRSFDRERGDWAVFPMIPYGRLETSSQVLAPPSAQHWLGTDEVGRDLAARVIFGARVSMLVGFVSVGISSVIGIILGALAGYCGGVVDILLSRIIEILMSFPVIILVLAILAFLPPSIWNVMIVLGLVRWTGIARYVRGELIRLRDSEFRLAATALGASHTRVLFRHLIPNAMAPVFVTVTFGIASAILIEAGLSFLGFGVMPPAPSWGNILKEGWDNLQNASYMIYPPCIAIFIGVLSYNLVGDTLRDAIDPRVSRT